jgi:hypothetical protein
LKLRFGVLLKKPEENLELFGLYFTIIHLIKAEKFEDAKKLLEKLER